jgi:hypothetical protein
MHPFPLLTMTIGIIAGILGGLAGGAAVLWLASRAPQRLCPDCHKPLPRFRKPANVRQLLWGGWTCPDCAVEIDRQGRKIAA